MQQQQTVWLTDGINYPDGDELLHRPFFLLSWLSRKMENLPFGHTRITSYFLLPLFHLESAGSSGLFYMKSNLKRELNSKTIALLCFEPFQASLAVLHVTMWRASACRYAAIRGNPRQQALEATHLPITCIGTLFSKPQSGCSLQLGTI